MIASTRLLASCIVLLTSITALAQSDGVKFEWKFEKGAKFQLAMSQTQTMQMNIGGQKIPNSSENKSWVVWEVADVASTGEATILSKLNRMQMSIDGPTGKILFDTDDKQDAPGAAPFAKGIRPMVGVATKQTMLPTGKITEVEMPEELKQAMAGLGAGAADMVKQLNKNASLEFGTESLKIGDSWTKESTVPSPIGKMTLATTYEYEGKKDAAKPDLHSFAVQLKMNFEKGAPGTPQITIKNQTSNGTIVFDNKKGRLESSKLKQNFDMEISVQGQQLQQSMKQLVEAQVTDL